jgi:hypothetical protein
VKEWKRRELRHFKDNFKPMAKDIREVGDAQGMMKMISERTGIEYEALEYNPEDQGRDPHENN